MFTLSFLFCSWRWTQRR